MVKMKKNYKPYTYNLHYTWEITFLLFTTIEIQIGRVLMQMENISEKTTKQKQTNRRRKLKQRGKQEYKK